MNTFKNASTAFRQLELPELKRVEFRRLVKQLKKLPNFDSAAERIIFLKFDSYIPKKEEEISYCRTLNEKVADMTMDTLAKVVTKYTEYRM